MDLKFGVDKMLVKRNKLLVAPSPSLLSNSSKRARQCKLDSYTKCISQFKNMLRPLTFNRRQYKNVRCAKTRQQLETWGYPTDVLMCHSPGCAGCFRMNC